MFGLDIVGEKFIEEMFLSQLDGLNVGDFDLAVKGNVNLLEETLKHRSHVLRMGERIAKQFNGQKEYLTPENLMIWLKKKREDLYFAILLDKTGKKKRWLEIQMEQFKQYLWE